MRIARACVCCGSGDLDGAPAVLMPFLAHRIFGWESVEVTPEWGLRDLAPGRAYALCRSLSCRACGLLFLDMRFDDAEMAALYADYRGPAYRAERERFEPGYGARNDRLNEDAPARLAAERLLAPFLGTRPRVLDWGGDDGRNTPFRDACALHHVLDISGKAVRAGAVRVGPAEVVPGAYDLVVSSQVLEHLPFPGETVAAMAAIMDADTVLSVEVPHETLMHTLPDPADRLAGKRHWHEHVNVFTPDALHALLARSELRALETRSHPVEAGGQTAHVLSLVCRRA